MGTKASKKQGQDASKRVAAVTAFSTAGKNAQMRKLAAKTKLTNGKGQGSKRRARVKINRGRSHLAPRDTGVVQSLV